MPDCISCDSPKLTQHPTLAVGSHGMLTVTYGSRRVGFYSRSVCVNPGPGCMAPARDLR